MQPLLKKLCLAMSVQLTVNRPLPNNSSLQGDRRLFYLPHRQIQGIDTVTCDGVPLAPSEYTSSREEGWVTVSTVPVESLEVTYRYSPSQDMAVTNWDSNIGNYLYYNKLINYTLPELDFKNYTGPDLECSGTLSWGRYRTRSKRSGELHGIKYW